MSARYADDSHEVRGLCLQNFRFLKFYHLAKSANSHFVKSILHSQNKFAKILAYVKKKQYLCSVIKKHNN